jgi:hypothetical protein
MRFQAQTKNVSPRISDAMSSAESSSDADVVSAYIVQCPIYLPRHRVTAGNPGISCIESGSAQSAGPSDGWSLRAWLKEITLEEIADHILVPKDLEKFRGENAELKALLSLSENDFKRRLSSDELSRKLVAIVHSAFSSLVEESQTSENSSASLGSRFLQDTDALQYSFGTENHFYGGLDSYIGRPKDPDVFSKMQWEHCSSPYAHTEFTAGNYGVTTDPNVEWNFVVFATETLPGGTKNGVPLQRAPIPFSHFENMQQSTRALLTRAEVTALRLYTGPMFACFNQVLRNPSANQGKFLYTIHALASGVIKLSRFQNTCEVWRGLSGGVLPASFMEPDKFGCCGGTDFGFMSTTTDKKVALDYARSKPPSIVFKMVLGLIDRGADISWLSQYPMEQEILFPPLTSLEVIGKPRTEGSVVIFNLRQNCNLRIQTVDELVNKSKSMHMDSLDFLFEEAKNTIFDFDVSTVCPGYLQSFDYHRDEMRSLSNVWYNNLSNYKNAVNSGLMCFEGTLAKPRVLLTLLSLHGSSEISQVIEQLKIEPASTFADARFVQQYVAFDILDSSGSQCYKNYSSVWNLPLTDSGWQQLLTGRSCDVVEITGEEAGLVVKVLRFLLTNRLARSVIEPISSPQLINDLAGPAGVYFYMGRTKNSRPYYQNVVNWKYIYFEQGAWYLGQTLGSTNADLKCSSDVPHPGHAVCWESRTSSGLRSIMKRSVAWKLQSGIQATLVAASPLPGDLFSLLMTSFPDYS